MSKNYLLPCFGCRQNGPVVIEEYQVDRGMSYKDSLRFQARRRRLIALILLGLVADSNDRIASWRTPSFARSAPPCGGHVFVGVFCTFAASSVGVEFGGYVTSQNRWCSRAATGGKAGKSFAAVRAGHFASSYDPRGLTC